MGALEPGGHDLRATAAQACNLSLGSSFSLACKTSGRSLTTPWSVLRVRGMPSGQAQPAECRGGHQAHRPRGRSAGARGAWGVGCAMSAASSLEAAPCRGTGEGGVAAPAEARSGEQLLPKDLGARGPTGKRGGRWRDWPEWVGSTFAFGSGSPTAALLPARPAGPRSPFSPLFTPPSFFLFLSSPAPPPHALLSAALQLRIHRGCPPWVFSAHLSQFSRPFNVPSRLLPSRAPLQPPLHFSVLESLDAFRSLRPASPCSSPLSPAAPAGAEAFGRSVPAPGLFAWVGVGFRPGR